MNDLISRSKLINDIVTYLFSDKCNLNELGRDIRKIIDSEPTAYDIDKVVEEFEKVKTINVDVGYGTIYKTIRKDVAIEIVKQGGVSDDVCEWELTDIRKLMPYKTSCDNEDLYDYSYKYCPYCGKKIKVVE